MVSSKGGGLMTQNSIGPPPKSASGRGNSGAIKLFNSSSSGKRATPQTAGANLRLGTSPAPPRSAMGILEQHNVREQDNVKVVVRVRPMNERETAAGEALAVQISETDTTSLQITSSAARGAQSRQFAFHGVLHPSCRQSDVLQACGITQLLDAALAGFHVTIFAYGQTGSGKTFTMSGREDVLALESYSGDSDDGIVTRSVMYLFEQIKKRPKTAAAVSVRASYCEIYNEALYDLLRFSKQQLSVRWDAQRGFHAPDLAVKDCVSVEDLIQVISKGMHNRRIGSHELNLESSRSHSIFTVYCNTSAGEDNGECARFGKVSFVDLAGSERVKDTHTTGEMLKETSSINRSLFTLGKVIAALAERETGGMAAAPHIPYRDSKLTKLLMDSLGGSALALMVACISPATSAAEETLSTLSYAARAKNIRNQPVVQLDAKDAAIAALKREVALLRAENQYLRDQLDAAETGSTVPALALDGAAENPLATTPTLMTPRVRAAAIQGGAQGMEPLLARITEAEALLMRYSKENERLANLNNRLQFRRQFVDTDYTGALEEVDWLRMKLERIEGALKDQVGKGGTLARIMSRQMDANFLPGAPRGADHLQSEPSGEDLSTELGALLNKIAAHAKAEPGPPSFSATVVSPAPADSQGASLIISPAPTATPPGTAPAPAAAAAPSSASSADGGEEGPADDAVDKPQAGLKTPFEEVLPRPVSRRGRKAQDLQGSLTPPPVLAASPPKAGAGEQQQPQPAPANNTVAQPGAGSAQADAVPSADADVTIYVKGPPPGTGRDPAAGTIASLNKPVGSNGNADLPASKPAALPEKPWKKAKAHKASAPADKDGGGQIHADPDKLALLLE